MGLLRRISDISESTNQQCLEQLSHHISNHDAAIFLRTNALLRGHLREMLNPYLPKSDQFESVVHKFVAKVLPKLYMVQLYEVYAKRGSEKTNQYYNDLAQHVKDEEELLHVWGWKQPHIRAWRKIFLECMLEMDYKIKLVREKEEVRGIDIKSRSVVYPNPDPNSNRDVADEVAELALEPREDLEAYDELYSGKIGMHPYGEEHEDVDVQKDQESLAIVNLSQDSTNTAHASPSRSPLFSPEHTLKRPRNNP